MLFVVVALREMLALWFIWLFVQKLILEFNMDFSYQTYVQRYQYDDFCWPPDLGLAELHARCSEPGLVNHLGVKCPCCGRRSKKILDKWWKRKITEDLKEYGSAIPGYFQLMKFYGCFIFLVILINSIYPIYANYYTCMNLDPDNNYCLDVGFLYYIEFNQMIKLLNKNGDTDMVNILMILQTVVFYVLLGANFLSIFYITLLNDSARQQIKQKRSSKASRFLMFHNLPENGLTKIMAQIREKNNEDNTQIVRVIKIYDIKKYYQYFKIRNQIYYKILSLYVIPKDPILATDLNKKLEESHTKLLKEKKKFEQYSGKVVVMFSSTQAKNNMSKIYQVKTLKRWQYGLKTILKDMGIEKSQFEDDLCTVPLVEGSDLKWENMGEGIGLRSASRFKTFIVAAIFIVICYIILYYPILFSMKTHVKEQTQIFVHLNTFEKILPNITSLILVFLSIYFRSYMEKLGEERSPKDQLEKSTFVLLSTLTFHIIFFVLLPTLFFMIPSSISPTVKLYVISGQARTFIVIQLIIVLIDMPYRLWKNKKIRNLSDQRFAFRYNQRMLHATVESRDYPLEIRVLILFRVWSLALFYSFFSAYILVYVLIAFTIIFWTEKHNLYKHYSVRRKISIKLFSEVLIYFVNFFSLFICFIYCFNVEQSPVKISLAVLFTVGSVIGNIVYWILLNKQDEQRISLSRQSSEKSSDRDSKEIDPNLKDNLLLKEESQKNINIWSSAQNFQLEYKKFINAMHNDELDEEISNYLDKVRNHNQKPINRSVSIEMVNYGLSEEESAYINEEESQFFKSFGFDSD